MNIIISYIIQNHLFDNINIYHHLLRLKHWKKRFVRKWNHWMSKYLEWRKDWLHTLTWKGRIINYYNLQSNIFLIVPCTTTKNTGCHLVIFRLRQAADIRRTSLEEEHLSLGTRRVVATQKLTASQNAHDTLARQLADNETYVQLNNMEKKVCT